MKLLRLKLENWRGVTAAEVQFDAQVTLVEGPNEIGKSSLVESLRLLFSEKSTSKKQSVQSVQPVGLDLGSRVEAEVESGEYHFVYSKTYNRQAQTQLQILRPSPAQLTGGDAHDRATEILDETIDRALWNALLVEQGGMPGNAALADSRWLAAALDETAGSGQRDNDDDGALFALVEAEHERYFTLKSGKPRFAALETDRDAARQQYEAAEVELAAVDTLAAQYQQFDSQLQRLQAMLPELRSTYEQLREQGLNIDRLQQRVQQAQTQHSDALQLLQQRQNALTQRETLRAELQQAEQALTQLRQRSPASNEEQAAARVQLQAAQQQLVSVSEALNVARLGLQQARTDQALLQAVTDRQGLLRQLEAVQEQEQRRLGLRKELSRLSVDDDALESLTAAERDCLLARGQRDSAAAELRITVVEPLDAIWNEQPLRLMPADPVVRPIVEPLTLQLPGIAELSITPPDSAAQRAVTAEEAEGRLQALLSEYRVADIPAAIVTNRRRNTLATELQRVEEQLQDLLQQTQQADLQVQLEYLDGRIEAYRAQRQPDHSPPETLVEAGRLVAQAEDAQEAAELAASQAQAAQDSARESNHRLELALQEAQRDNAIQRELVARQRESLVEQREAISDTQLQTAVQQSAAVLAERAASLAAAELELQQADPDSLAALATNAHDALQRAERERDEQDRNLAVLSDRLQRAQADGRYQQLQQAESVWRALDKDYRQTERRALAAQRLYRTLSEYRDSSRRAYVRPLREGIEQLGRLVFGQSFSLQLADDWTIVSRTLSGQTVPFADLSVGTREQLGILTRLAAARIVAGQGGVPVIIDDALGFSDPLRLQSMGAAVALAARDCQVILLSCTPGRFAHVGNATLVNLQ